METRRVLRRSREDFFAFGVCGGLGRYLGVDPGWLRVLVLLLPPLWLPYLLAGIVLPLERPGDELGPPTPRMRRRGALREASGGGIGAALGALLRRKARRQHRDASA